MAPATTGEQLAFLVSNSSSDSAPWRRNSSSFSIWSGIDSSWGAAEPWSAAVASAVAPPA